MALKKGVPLSSKNSRLKMFSSTDVHQGGQFYCGVPCREDKAKILQV